MKKELEKKPIYLRCIGIHTRRQININSDCARQVELAVQVQCASPMPTHHSSCRSKLIHISSAACWTIQALLDAVACGFYEREGEVDFRYYPGDVEAGGVPDAGFVDRFEAGADGC